VSLSTIGADVARGTLTGTAKRSADGSWQVDNLQLNEIRLQSDKSLADFFAPLTTLPSLQIGRLDVTDARLQGPDWAVAGLDLNLRNLTLSRGDWQSQDGTLSMNASEFIYGSLHFLDPILNAEFSPQGIALRQFTSRWEGGMVRTPATGCAPVMRWCWTTPPSPGWNIRCRPTGSSCGWRRCPTGCKA
jgi:hypothetical protein